MKINIKKFEYFFFHLEDMREKKINDKTNTFLSISFAFKRASRGASQQSTFSKVSRISSSSSGLRLFSTAVGSFCFYETLLSKRSTRVAYENLRRNYSYSKFFFKKLFYILFVFNKYISNIYVGLLLKFMRTKSFSFLFFAI